MKKFIFIFSLLAFASISKAQSLAQNRCDDLGKGVNLSNWLEAYWQVNWPNPTGYNKSFLVEIKKAGIKSVRLPICFANITDTVSPYHVDVNHPLFNVIDSVIAWTDELNMNLLIDNHHGWNLSDSTWRSAMPRMANLWGVLARRYASLDPEQYHFELINEPPLGFSNDSLQFILNACIDSIRPYAPLHSIVASPAFASTGLGFWDFEPLTDTNIIYSIHCYDPYPFTHQGFPWSAPYYLPGIIFPGGNYDFLYQASWDSFETWNTQYHLPVFLGEFGAGIHADEQSRCNWIDSISRRINTHEMSWFYWDVQYDFQLFNGSIIHKDSINPCFRQALRLYDDSTSTFAIDEINGADAVSVYPNPASDKFICQTNIDGSILSIFDCMGHHIYIVTFNGQTEVKTDNWKDGIYYLRIHVGGETLFKKIIRARK